MNEKKTDQGNNEALSWVLIIVSFALFWPLGLFLLFRKLFGDDDKTKSKKVDTAPAGTDLPPTWNMAGEKKNGAPAGNQTFSKRIAKTPSMKRSTRMALKIIGGVLAVGCAISAIDSISYMIFYPPVYRYEILELLQMLAIGGGGLLMFGKGLSMDKDDRRFHQYLAVLGDAPSMELHEIAQTMGVSDRKAEKDLKCMISQGYFGGTAYIDAYLGYFFRSQTAAETARAKQRTQAPPKEAEQGYCGVLREIRRANDEIADAELSAKIDRLEEVTAQIFRVIEKDEKKEKQVRMFLEYYLPTTQKLLDSYAEFESAGVDGDNLRMAKEKIRATMDNIVRGFENQLDALYASEAMDIQTDIDVMNNMMQRDSAMREKDFHVDGSSAAAEEEEKK